MIVILIYMSVVLLATTCGAIAGLGGGVIMKPLFDAVGLHNATTIGFYSSVAVFTMCIVSIIKQMKKGFKFDIQIVSFISVGSIVGGFLGEKIFGLVASTMPNNIVKAIQATLLLFVLIGILMYTLKKHSIKSYTIKNGLMIALAGAFLGSVSVFLGIGGGPLNIAVLMILFSFDMKASAVYSIATIFFSQISKLSMVLMAGEFLTYDLSLLPFIMVSAVAGGFIGTMINQKLPNKKVEKIYIYLMVALIFLSIYNIASNLL